MEIYVVPCVLFLLNLVVGSITGILAMFIVSFVYGFVYAYLTAFMARIRDFKMRMNGKDV